MKRIIITLLTTILVFLATLFVVNDFIRQQAVEEADEKITMMLDAFRQSMDHDLLMTENSVYSFLAAFDKQSNDNVDYVAVDERDENFLEPRLKRQLSSFLDANPYYRWAAFVFQTDSLGATKESFRAYSLEQDADSFVNLAATYDFSTSENIKHCRSTKHSTWALPSAHSPMAGQIVSYYVPLCRHSDGAFLGVFVVNVTVSTINQKLVNHLPYGKQHSEMVVATNDHRVIASYPSTYTDHTLSTDLEASLEKQGKAYVGETGNGGHIVRYKGNTYFQFTRHLKNAPWQVHTVCNADAVYAKSHHIGRILLLTSVLGMLLMLVSCVAVSFQVRKTHLARQAAEHELTMAASVQASILRQPQAHTPHAQLSAFIRPAREAGGDLYDYAERDGKLIFCIGDVSGKGMPAALFMTQVVSLFRSAVRLSTRPSDIVASINNVLAEANPDMTFCTLFVAQLDGSQLTFCNAGHDPALLLSPTAGCSFIQQQSNIAVGLLPDYPYTDQHATLQPGDTLLLYTDGVTEAKNRKHHMFGQQAILTTLQPLVASTQTSNPASPQASPQASSPTQEEAPLLRRGGGEVSPLPLRRGGGEVTTLINALTAFVDGAEQSDDITILSVHSS